MDFVKCDHCGDLLEKTKENVSCVEVLVASSIYDPRTIDPKTEYDRMIFALTTGGKAEQARTHEHFDLCRACAMSLLIGLKSAKLAVKKGRPLHAH